MSCHRSPGRRARRDPSACGEDLAENEQTPGPAGSVATASAYAYGCGWTGVHGFSRFNRPARTRSLSPQSPGKENTHAAIDAERVTAGRLCLCTSACVRPCVSRVLFLTCKQHPRPCRSLAVQFRTSGWVIRPSAWLQLGIGLLMYHFARSLRRPPGQVQQETSHGKV